MREKRRTTFVLLTCIVLAGASYAQQRETTDEVRIDAAMHAAFPKASPDWLSRLKGDQTMQACSQYRDAPPAEVARAIAARESATIQYPSDGKLIGDWKKGEHLAQSGYGLRFTDYPPTRESGGNCYACHQLTKQEVSYGTVGPSLFEYGKIRKFSEAETQAAYEKIYDSHAAFPCSLMPRFGTNGVLTIEQINEAFKTAGAEVRNLTDEELIDWFNLARQTVWHRYRETNALSSELMRTAVGVIHTRASPHKAQP
jgi:L-cysteine S-thiosulfotransferase